MAVGLHYFRDGTKYRGSIHKHKDGTIMTGARMTPASKKVVHFSDLSETAQKEGKEKIMGYGKKKGGKKRLKRSFG